MLTAAEGRLLADEVGETISGSRLQKVSGPGPERIVLEFFGEAGKQRLLVALETDTTRFHLAQAAQANPQRPFALVELLRKELVGSRLTTVRALEGERIVQMDFQVRRDERSEERLLFLELFTKGRNLVLTNGGLEVIGVLRRQASRPALRPGGSYAPPSQSRGTPPDEPTPFAFLGETPPTGQISSALETWAVPREAEVRREHLKRTLTTQLSKRLKKERRLLKNLQQDLEEAERADEYRRYGELLKQNLGEIPKGATTVELTDWSSGEEIPVHVPLDTKESPKDAMARWFKAAKKLDRSLPKVATRVGNAEERVQAVGDLLERVQATDDLVVLEDLHTRAERAGWVKPEPGPDTTPTPTRARKEPERRKPYRTFISKDGVEILVGRNSSDNDELSMRIARGNEAWFHIAGFSGSHVVVRSSQELPPETLLDAAVLAAHFSKAPAGAKVEVHRTQAKHVSKFRGARPGQVQLAKYKSMRVRTDEPRLDRLLNTAGR